MSSSLPLHLQQILLLLSLLCSHAFASSIVTHLPGFRGHLPFHLETGYVSVDDLAGVQLFYYFIESEGNPKEDPLLLWLTGGPGCSGLCGLFFELGPLKVRKVEYNGSLPTLTYFPYSWTKVASIIFLDSPVGAGFSFSSSNDGFIVGDITSSKHVYKFLQKWLTDHSQFLSNPLYIAGDSYAGKVVPVVTYYIVQGIESGDEPHMNIKGYLIGNAFTGERIDKLSRVPFAHNMGIISDELYESTTRCCGGEDYDNPTNPMCATKLEVVNKFLSELNPFHILDPKCVIQSPKPNDLIGERKRSLMQRDTELIKPPDIPALECKSYTYYLTYYWANNNEVREALHVQKGTVPEWERCRPEIRDSYAYDILSNIKYHHVITTKGYRALVYSGDHDPSVPFIGTQEWIKSLNFSIVDDWRSWFVAGQVAGYTRSYSNNLTFATIKGAGHTAPEFKPKQCFAMIKRWLFHKPL